MCGQRRARLVWAALRVLCGLGREALSPSVERPRALLAIARLIEPGMCNSGEKFCHFRYHPRGTGHGAHLIAAAVDTATALATPAASAASAAASGKSGGKLAAKAGDEAACAAGGVESGSPDLSLLEINGPTSTQSPLSLGSLAEIALRALGRQLVARRRKPVCVSPFGALDLVARRSAHVARRCGLVARRGVPLA